MKNDFHHIIESSKKNSSIKLQKLNFKMPFILKMYFKGIS